MLDTCRKTYIDNRLLQVPVYWLPRTLVVHVAHSRDSSTKTSQFVNVNAGQQFSYNNQSKLHLQLLIFFIGYILEVTNLRLLIGRELKIKKPLVNMTGQSMAESFITFGLSGLQFAVGLDLAEYFNRSLWSHGSASQKLLLYIYGKY